MLARLKKQKFTLYTDDAVTERIVTDLLVSERIPQVKTGIWYKEKQIQVYVITPSLALTLIKRRQFENISFVIFTERDGNKDWTRWRDDLQSETEKAKEKKKKAQQKIKELRKLGK